MEQYEIRPTVDESREFLEIAQDFANPLDIVREAISNAFDASATHISLIFDTIEQVGENQLRIRLSDDGNGMGEEELQAFFDLGNSVNAGNPNAIGEKGHGTKVYFNSAKVELITVQEGEKRKAVLENPLKHLYEGNIPKVSVSVTEADEEECGTIVTVHRYNNNQMKPFTHERLKDHILWFTKHGSIESEFDIDDHKDVSITLKGLDREEAENIPFGHPFPKESDSVEDLFEEYVHKAPGHYCRRFISEGVLENHPSIRYEAVFSIEGKYVKWNYNPMLRHQGYAAPAGAYTVRERYGLWLCKDFIPVDRKNIWLTESGRGFEFTKFHAFVNCQGLNLTANRDTVDNTPQEILEDLHDEVRRIYEEITETEEWALLDWLEDQAEAERTIRREAQEFRTRKSAAKSAEVAVYEGHQLIAPGRESGVYGLLVKLLTVEPNLFPFSIVSYDTRSGIDLLVKADRETPVSEADLYFVELKHTLTNQRFNHSFRNTHSIVCWSADLDEGQTIQDIREDARQFEIVYDEARGYSRRFLSWPTESRRIEVFVLEEYLPDRLDLTFEERNVVED